MGAAVLDLPAIEAKLQMLERLAPGFGVPFAEDAAALLAQCRALRAALQDDPLGDGLTDVLSRAAKSLWGQNAEDDPVELGRILSGRAMRIAERAAAVLAQATDHLGKS